MLEIDNKIISLDILERHFVCDLDQCLGICCVEGDSGAPIEPEEVLMLEQELEAILPYLPEKGRQAIKEQGVAVIDIDGDLGTPLIGEGGTCAYAYFNQCNVCLCGIEKAYRDKKISFHKPISCHLYPIRLANLGDTIALNYDQWKICDQARVLGNKEKVPVYRFLREPIIRRFGEDFYNKLDKVYKQMEDEKNKKQKNGMPIK